MPNFPENQFVPMYDTSESLAQIDCAANLNGLEVASCEGYGRLKEAPPLTSLVRPVFRNIETELIQAIKSHDCIVGCVAWLTSVPILQALQGKSVCFIVQQEDWLRPDSDEWSTAKQRGLYSELEGIDFMVANVSYCMGGSISPIRLSGKPKSASRNNPRMHHKFALFGRTKTLRQEAYVNTSSAWSSEHWDLMWTGSYNFTANATRSLENGIFISDQSVIDCYFTEWRQVLLTSFRVEDKWWGESYGWNANDDSLRDGS